MPQNRTTIQTNIKSRSSSAPKLQPITSRDVSNAQRALFPRGSAGTKPDPSQNRNRALEIEAKKTTVTTARMHQMIQSLPRNVEEEGSELGRWSGAKIWQRRSKQNGTALDPGSGMSSMSRSVPRHQSSLCLAPWRGHRWPSNRRRGPPARPVDLLAWSKNKPPPLNVPWSGIL